MHFSARVEASELGGPVVEACLCQCGGLGEAFAEGCVLGGGANCTEALVRALGDDGGQGFPAGGVSESQRDLAKDTTRCDWESCSTRFAQASRVAGELLIQLAPLLEAFSERVYHRDITPRNILIEDGPQGPNFGLVDFGLAVDATTWRNEDSLLGDLGGDGRYWPTSAWYVFCFGAPALKNEPSLRQEYKTCLDLHSMGLTTLKCIVEMLPDMSALQLNAPSASRSAVRSLMRLCEAWKSYWSSARRHWQPVFEAFSGSGNFDSLRVSYTSTQVYRLVSEDLCALHAALGEAKNACQGLPNSSGLSGMGDLLTALLLMVQTGRPADQVSQPEVATKALFTQGTMKQGSVSTSASTSNSRSSLASGALDLNEREAPCQNTGCKLVAKAADASSLWATFPQSV